MEPTRLGHEVTLTIIEVGTDLQDRYQAGTAAGRPARHLPGGQEHGLRLHRSRRPDSVPSDRPRSAGNRRRRLPAAAGRRHGLCRSLAAGAVGLRDGVVHPTAPSGAQSRRHHVDHRPSRRRRASISFSAGSGRASHHRPDRCARLGANSWCAESTAEVIVRTTVCNRTTYAALSAELTDGKGFDDIVVLDPRSAPKRSASVAKQIARRGTLNLVGETALDGLVDDRRGPPALRLHRLHRQSRTGHRRLLRRSAQSLRTASQRRGRLHWRRRPDGPDARAAGHRTAQRTAPDHRHRSQRQPADRAIKDRFAPLAEKNGRELLIFNPMPADKTLARFCHGGHRPTGRR